MGSGLSAPGQESCNGTSPLSADTFKTLQDAYESAKDLEDVDLFNALEEVYRSTTLEGECLESNIKELKESTPARNKDFIFACGAFYKGTAKADIKKAKELFEAGVDVDFVDDDGWSALFHACGEGHLHVVEWLTEDCGANVELKDPDGCTPLWVASFNNRRNVVQHLLLIGADDTIKAQPEGEPSQTPSFAARRNKHPGLADFIDEETSLRKLDASRRNRQLSRNMNIEEFRESMRKKGGRQE